MLCLLVEFVCDWIRDTAGQQTADHSSFGSVHESSKRSSLGRRSKSIVI